MAEIRSDHLYTMPPHFGGQPGGMQAITYHDTVSASLWYETDGARLAKLLPPGFSLDVPQIMVSAVMNRGVEWMGGEPYNLLSVNVPVTFRGREDEVSGWYALVVWENNAIPIAPGREGTGIPKIYGEVEDFRWTGDEIRTWAHRAGHTFCHLHFGSVAEADSAQRADIENTFSRMQWMGWRYIQQTGSEPGAALSQPTLFPQDFELTQARVAQGTIEWSVPPNWQNPTQLPFIQAIADLPVSAPVGPALIVNAKNVLRGDAARTLR